MSNKQEELRIVMEENENLSKIILSKNQELSKENRRIYELENKI